MKKIFTENTKKTLSSKGLAALMALLFVFGNNVFLKAQSVDYQFGVRGGIGITTLNGYENNGLKLGLAAGVCGKYYFSKNISIIADIDYSTGGQQSEKWLSTNDIEKVKMYSKYNIHYINIPILYQYYFTDILGLEAGLNFRYRLAGNLKTKIGNDSWKNTDVSYNDFDCGLIFGVYTDNLIPHEDFFVSLRAYFGFLDVVQDVGSNKNVSVQVSVGYMLF